MRCRWGDGRGSSGEGNGVIVWEMGVAVGRGRKVWQHLAEGWRMAWGTRNMAERKDREMDHDTGLHSGQQTYLFVDFLIYQCISWNINIKKGRQFWGTRMRAVKFKCWSPEASQIILQIRRFVWDEPWLHRLNHRLSMLVRFLSDLTLTCCDVMLTSTINSYLNTSRSRWQFSDVVIFRASQCSPLTARPQGVIGSVWLSYSEKRRKSLSLKVINFYQV